MREARGEQGEREEERQLHWPLILARVATVVSEVRTDIGRDAHDAKLVTSCKVLQNRRVYLRQKEEFSMRHLLSDTNIRASLKQHLTAEHGEADAVFLDEMLLLGGSGRADVAFVNGSLHGFEIKGQSDRLGRLQDQSTLYDLIFDESWIVTTDKHLNGAMEIVNPWWGVVLVEVDARDLLALQVLRRATANPYVDTLHVVQLLKKPEAVKILQEAGISRGLKSQPTYILHEMLLGCVPDHQLRAEVRKALKRRANATSAAPST